MSKPVKPARGDKSDISLSRRTRMSKPVKPARGDKSEDVQAGQAGQGRQVRYLVVSENQDVQAGQAGQGRQVRNLVFSQPQDVQAGQAGQGRQIRDQVPQENEPSQPGGMFQPGEIFNSRVPVARIQDGQPGQLGRHDRVTCRQAEAVLQHRPQGGVGHRHLGRGVVLRPSAGQAQVNRGEHQQQQNPEPVHGLSSSRWSAGDVPRYLNRSLIAPQDAPPSRVGESGRDASSQSIFMTPGSSDRAASSGTGTQLMT